MLKSTSLFSLRVTVKENGFSTMLNCSAASEAAVFSFSGRGNTSSWTWKTWRSASKILTWRRLSGYR